MQRSPSSPHSSSSNEICIGVIPVVVSSPVDPNFVPSGITLSDPGPTMVDTRSGDMRRLEEMFKSALTEFTARAAESDRRRDEADKLRDQLNGSRDQSMKELREELLALQMQQNDLMTRLNPPVAGIHAGGAPPVAGAHVGGAPPRAQYFATRQSKVGFPIFNGEDLAGWILRCDHFFTVDLTPADAKVRLAVINFEGRALQWFQNWSKYQDHAMDTPWPMFIQALEGRFSDQLFGDPMTELLTLKQSGSFADYHDRFESLLGRVAIPESYAISHFINGLKPLVQKAVRMFMPQTLVHAYALARLQDSSNVGVPTQNTRKFTPAEPRYQHTSTPLLPTPTVPMFKNKRLLTEEEMADKRARGLCYGCDEKCEKGHRCLRKQLYLLEIDDGGRELYATEGRVHEDQEVVTEEDNPLISIHALNGSS